MLSPLAPTLRIGLSRTGITLLKTSGWRRRLALVADKVFLEPMPVTPERILQRLPGILADASCANLATVIVLADDWVRFFMVAPPNNAKRLLDCQAAAHMRFQSLYDEPMNDWQLEADWQPSRPFLACAIPRALLNALHQTALQQRLTLIQIVPQFVAAFNGWRQRLKPDAWFGVVHENGLMLAANHNRHLSSVRAAAVPIGSSLQNWLPEHVAREALRFNLAPPTRIQLCGMLPDRWAIQTMGALQCLRLDTSHVAVEGGMASAGVFLAHTGCHA